MKNIVLNSFLILACATSLVSCNKSDGYKVLSQVSALESGDLERKIMCEEAMNLEACTALKDQCTIVYGDSEDADGVRPFSACIANPNIPTPPTDPILPPTDPILPPADPILPPADPILPPASPIEPIDPVVDLPDEEIPVEDYVNANGKCSNLDEKYLLRKGKGQPKVLVCHSTSSSAVTISVACPALKAHTAHHDGRDVLGVCK